MTHIMAFWNALCALNRLSAHNDYRRTYRGGQCRSCWQITCPCPLGHCALRMRQDAQVAPMMCACASQAIQARIPCSKAGGDSALSAMMLPCSSSCSIPPIPRCPFKYRRSLSIPAVRNRARIRSRNYITLSHPGFCRAKA